MVERINRLSILSLFVSLLYLSLLFLFQYLQTMRAILLQCWIHIFGITDDGVSTLQQGSDHRQICLQNLPNHRVLFRVENPSVNTLKFEEVSSQSFDDCCCAIDCCCYSLFPLSRSFHLM